MSMFLKNVLVSQSQVGFFLFSKLVKYAEHRTRQIIFLSRFLSNSGLIAGCCFSRQSDEEAVIPKSNSTTSMDNQTVYKLYPEPTIVQKVTRFFKMKRKYDAHDDDLTSDQNCVETETDHLIETCTKRPKTNDHKTDSTEDVDSEFILESHIRQTSKNDTIVDVHSVITPSNEILDVPEVKPWKKTSKSYIQKPEKQRPNYFVAIQISDAQIIKSLNEVQQHLLEKDERLRKSMIQLSTLHITLMVMYIGDTATHTRALKVLENIHQEHNADFCRNPLKLEFKGLSHFQNRVLYAKLSTNDSFKRLSSLVESVRKHYAGASIHSTDSKTHFTPHLTIAKIRDTWMKKNEDLKKIDPTLYQEFNHQYFGSQEVQGIQLLRMMGPKDEVGYYTGNTIYFSTFKPKIKRDRLNKLLETEKKKEDIKEKINALMKEKLK